MGGGPLSGPYWTCSTFCSNPAVAVCNRADVYPYGCTYDNTGSNLRAST